MLTNLWCVELLCRNPEITVNIMSIKWIINAYQLVMSRVITFIKNPLSFVNDSLIGWLRYFKFLRHNSLCKMSWHLWSWYLCLKFTIKQNQKRIHQMIQISIKMRSTSNVLGYEYNLIALTKCENVICY